MEAQDDKIFLIPMEDGKEAMKQRQEIISQVYRKWTEENPDKRVYNRSLKDYINIRYLSITETIAPQPARFLQQRSCRAELGSP